MIRDEILRIFNELITKPITQNDLAKLLEIDLDQMSILKKVLDDMVRDGELVETKKKKYSTPEMSGLISGNIIIKQRGFGFVLCDDKNHVDIFIPADETNGAMTGDKVLVKAEVNLRDPNKMEGTVVKITKRAHKRIVGSLMRNGRQFYIKPDDKKLNFEVVITGSDYLGAVEGDKVVAEITKWPLYGDEMPKGNITEVLGRFNDPGVDILSILKKFNLPEEFPDSVIEYTEKVESEILQSEIVTRTDLRDELIVTIDGEDAKDLDDAISIKKKENGNYVLGVHIADVTHYVKENCPLDIEALDRGTSVYLLDRVVPMLPPKLSNGICSLHYGVDRLTLSIDMEINPQGKVVNHHIYNSVIRSSARLNYTEVSNFLEGNTQDVLLNSVKGEVAENPEEVLSGKYCGSSTPELLELIKTMGELCLILQNRRKERGAVDFDFPEAMIVLGEGGKAVDIKERERRIANRLIEEFMLIANETIAERFFWMEVPFVYRIHEKPDEERLRTFKLFAAKLGYVMKGGKSGEVHPKAMQQLIEEVQGSKYEGIISRLMLRSMKQARYSPEDKGHFGLAAEHYCHFTSPIRRYPDLQIHRIIKETLEGALTGKRIEKLTEIVERAATESSRLERNAELAERDVDDMKKAEYMQSYVGDVFEGIITSIMSFGMFVELDNTVEGLVKIEHMIDDIFVFDEDSMTLIGTTRGKIYNMGDTINVKVKSSNVERREIEFTVEGGNKIEK